MSMSETFPVGQPPLELPPFVAGVATHARELITHLSAKTVEISSRLIPRRLGSLALEATKGTATAAFPDMRTMLKGEESPLSKERDGDFPSDAAHAEAARRVGARDPDDDGAAAREAWVAEHLQQTWDEEE